MIKARWAGTYNSRVMSQLNVHQWPMMSPMPLKDFVWYSHHRTRKRWIIAFVIALGLLAGALIMFFGDPLGLLSLASAETTVYVNVHEDSSLTVRELPKLSAARVFSMDRGEQLLMETMDKYGWVSVSRAGDSGYCRVEYLSDSEPSTPVTYRTTARNVRVRDLPSATATTVDKLALHSEISVLTTITVDGLTWARVEQGFIQLRFLEAAQISLTVEED